MHSLIIPLFLFFLGEIDFHRIYNTFHLSQHIPFFTIGSVYIAHHIDNTAILFIQYDIQNKRPPHKIIFGSPQTSDKQSIMNSVIFIKSSSHRSLQIQSHPGTIPGPRNIFLQLFIHPVQDNLVIHLTFMFIFFFKKNDPLAIDPGLGRNPYKIRSIFIYIISSVKMEHIDTAIIYAASMLADTDSTLNKLFTGMVASKSLLEKVTDRQAVPGKGYMGWIRKERVILGNRAMMMDYGIKVPSQEYEQHYTLNQRRIVYMAVAGKLYAMFRIAYQSDPKIAADLELVHRTGMYLVVDCDDFNCDVRLLETAYGLPTGSVKVLSGAEHEAVAPAVAWLPESEGSMLHLGSFRSLVGGLVAAAGAAQGEKYASYALTLSVLASTAVGVLMTLTGGIVALPLIGIVLYQAAWLVITLFFPLMQR